MSDEINGHSDDSIWIGKHIFSGAATLVVIVGVAAVSYNIGGLVPVATAATPESVNAAPSATMAAPAAVRPELPPQTTVAPLKDVNGASFTFAQFFGKVMVVNLWATWCGPCRQEIPELVKLHKEFESRGVEMIGLSTENPEASAEKVRKFIQDFKIDYRIGWAPAEVAAPLMQGYDAIPQTFVISRDAFIVKRFVGFNPANTREQLKQAVEEALK